MIVKAKRKELLAQVRKAARAAPANHVLKALSGILFEADERTGIVRMTATNIDASFQTVLPTAVERTGSAVINARLFSEILGKLPGDNVDMDLRDSTLSISGGTSLYHVSVMLSEDYPKPDIPFPGAAVSVKGIKSVINSALFAVMPDTLRPVYNCLKFEISENGLRVIGSNGNCVVQVKGDPECRGNISLLIPAASLKTLAAIAGDSDVFELGVTGNNGVSKNAVFSDGTALFSAKLVEGDFFDTDKVFSRALPAAEVSLSAELLREAVAQLSGVSSLSQIALTVGNNKLTMKCETEIGSGVSRIDAVTDQDRDETYYFTTKNLFSCINTLKGSVTLCFTKDKALAICCGGIRYMQTGLRHIAKKEAA